MSNRTIFIVGGAVAAVVAVLIYRGARGGAPDPVTALVNGLGRLTVAQKRQIAARSTARSGKGHF